MWCPACDSLTSTLARCFEEGDPCEYCGLSHTAWSEILLIRAARNDDEMSQKFSELRAHNDKLIRELNEAHIKLSAIRNRVQGALR